MIRNQLRRDLYKGTNQSLRKASLNSFSFELEDSELLPLIILPKDTPEALKAKLNQLIFLGTYCKGATLVQLEIVDSSISSISKDQQPKDLSGKYDYYRGRLQSDRAKWLPPTQFMREVHDLRIFNLVRGILGRSSGKKKIDLPAQLEVRRK